MMSGKSNRSHAAPASISQTHTSTTSAGLLYLYQSMDISLHYTKYSTVVLHMALLSLRYYPNQNPTISVYTTLPYPTLPSPSLPSTLAYYSSTKVSS